jgi:hypothetical protein
VKILTEEWIPKVRFINLSTKIFPLENLDGPVIAANRKLISAEEGLLYADQFGNRTAFFF